MPRGHGESLSGGEVYSLTAFVLYKNGIVQESDVLDAASLPKIQMPNRNNFVPVNTSEIWEHNKPYRDLPVDEIRLRMLAPSFGRQQGNCGV
jgi:hypothetical protein